MTDLYFVYNISTVRDIYHIRIPKEMATNERDIFTAIRTYIVDRSGLTFKHRRMDPLASSMLKIQSKEQPREKGLSFEVELMDISYIVRLPKNFIVPVDIVRINHTSSGAYTLSMREEIVRYMKRYLPMNIVLF